MRGAGGDTTQHAVFARLQEVLRFYVVVIVAVHSFLFLSYVKDVYP